MVYGQVWCPTEAEWYFNYYDVGWTAGYMHVAYVSDTLIAGSNAQKLSWEFAGWNTMTQTPVNYVNPPMYTRYSSDRVDLWLDAEFDTLWYFGAGPGDQWQLPVEGTVDSFVVHVLDTGTVAIDGIDLRRLSVLLPGEDGMTPMNDTIIERVGSLSVFIHPQFSYYVDALTRGLRCYGDEELSYSTGIVPACDYNLATDDIVSATGVLIAPNPATDELVITFPDRTSYHTLDLMDVAGHVVLHDGPFIDRTSLDLSALRTGIYVCQVFDHSGSILIAKRLVKF